jgi:hypothetical protein
MLRRRSIDNLRVLIGWRNENFTFECRRQANSDTFEIAQKSRMSRQQQTSDNDDEIAKMFDDAEVKSASYDECGSSLAMPITHQKSSTWRGSWTLITAKSSSVSVSSVIVDSLKCYKVGRLTAAEKNLETETTLISMGNMNKRTTTTQQHCRRWFVSISFFSRSIRSLNFPTFSPRIAPSPNASSLPTSLQLAHSVDWLVRQCLHIQLKIIKLSCRAFSILSPFTISLVNDLNLFFSAFIVRIEASSEEELRVASIHSSTAARLRQWKL